MSMDGKTFEGVKRLLENLSVSVSEIHELLAYGGHQTLVRDFKEKSGVSLKGYRVKKFVTPALEAAKFYMRTTDSSLEEIADVSGFSDVSTMDKFFFKNTRRTAERWKKKYAKKTDVSETKTPLRDERKEVIYQQRKEIVSKARRLFRERSGLRIQDVAAEIGIHRVRMHRAFTAVTGRSAEKDRKFFLVASVVNSLVSPENRPFDLS